MNLNRVFLIGRLTADPQLRNTAAGRAVTTFGLATNRVWVNQQGQRQEQAEFHNIVVWGRQAEIASQFLKKGSLVFIEGRLQTRSWQDNQGQNRRITEVIAERFQLGPRAGGSIGDVVNQAEPSAGEHQQVDQSELPEINIDEENIKPEDIPF